MATRRELLIMLGASALAAPLACFAQQKGKVWRIGFLLQSEQSRVYRNIDVFKAGLRDLAYVEGRNYVIEQQFARDDVARLPALAAELLVLKVDLFVTSGTPSAEAAHNATREIPILITTVGDPVGSGFAASLRRPGGNVTGLTSIATELHSKRLDLLRQILPGMRRVGYLYNPDFSNDVMALRQFESDCAKLQFTSIRAPVRKAEEVATAFRILQREKAQGLIVSQASTNNAWRKDIVEHAAQHRLPAAYPISGYVESGGLFSYGTNVQDLYRRAAAYADKIFKGAKPGDLPIEQPTTFEMVLNLKTAKALGVTIPQSILVQANKIIE